MAFSAASERGDRLACAAGGARGMQDTGGIAALFRRVIHWAVGMGCQQMLHARRFVNELQLQVFGLLGRSQRGVHRRARHGHVKDDDVP